MTESPTRRSALRESPMNNYIPFPPTTNLFMVFLMWVGRLEILPVLVPLTPAYWQS